MGWWGKVIGGAFGYALGGPLGGLLGAAIGHSFDVGVQRIELEPPNWGAGDQERVQTAFFTAVFSVMGHVAKADGRVSEVEIQAARHIMAGMQLNPEQEKLAIELFNRGKQPEFDLQAVLLQFRDECHRRANLLQMFLEILLATALADQDLHANEQRILREVAETLGFSRHQFEGLLAMAIARQRYAQEGFHAGAKEKTPSLSDAYAALGVNENSTDEEIKKAYRRLMSQHHPDKLVSKGLPEEMVKIATEKTQEIRTAYEQIKRARGG
ncbi:co-chaperone DjlA [Hahella sp. HN01]|uniref:co-chaperone DjlA n=1 Tax=unclassified Hahella TaxID=2624107 RepID=UPI001C1E9E68|nr:co-chaperone DjlA [Hahella sp. HN01]MBU6954133.1 co-chaperone DjlA [Hahella sp. HN01]